MPVRFVELDLRSQIHLSRLIDPGRQQALNRIEARKAQRQSAGE